MATIASKLKLYMTSDCHLCEQAQIIIFSVLQTTVSEVDIADNDALLERYGVCIPVLQNTITQAELNWPFSGDQVLSFIHEFIHSEATVDC